MPLPPPGDIQIPSQFSAPRLTLEATLELGAEQTGRLRDLLEDDAVHSGRRCGSPLPGFDVLSCNLGIHTDGEHAEAAWVHYNFVFQSGTRPDEDAAADDWEEALGAVMEVLGAHEGTVRLVTTVPSEERTKSPTVLPFEVSMNGFSHVTGLRLVQADPDDLESELYSLIVDHQGSDTLLQGAAAVEVELQPGWVEGPWKQMMAVVKLLLDLDDEEVES